MPGAYIVGIGGTTRPNSSTEKALNIVLRACEDKGATTRLFAGDDLVKLPHYAPENPERTPEAQELVDELRRSDGVILGSSSYHGSVAGLVKNAIDYTQDLMDDDRPYLAGRAVGCIATGGGWQGVVQTLEHLRTIVHSLRGWPTPMGAALNTSQKLFDDDGNCIDERSAFQLTTVAEEVMEFTAR